MSLKENTEAIISLKSTAHEMGGKESITKQHQRNKLTARERIAKLVDSNSFDEIGILNQHDCHAKPLGNQHTPADGVICGFATMDSRPIAVVAYDFTVMAGSMGKVGEQKVRRLREQAGSRGTPLIWLLDSAGARVQEHAGTQFAASGELFRSQVSLSGKIPQVAAVMGPTAAGTSYIAGLADFVPMVKDIGTMALGGPALVKAAIGEEIDIDDLGGSSVHTTQSGVGHVECNDDESCLKTIREYLSFLPSDFRAPLPTRPSQMKEGDESIFDLIPDSPRRGFDMKQVIRWIADEDYFFEIHPRWATNILVGFIRIAGIPIGVVANQPMKLGGAIDLDAADKATRFMRNCDAFGIPLLFLHDCPGFMVGSKMEHAGIIRHGAKMLYTVSQLGVPKISVVVRKSYGAGYYVMCGRGYEPDLIVAWPGAEISLMSPEGAAAIVGKPDAVEEYRKKIDVRIAAEQGYIDDVIDPRFTSRILAKHFSVLVKKHDENRALRAQPKHGVMPV